MTTNNFFENKTKIIVAITLTENLPATSTQYYD